MNVDARKQLYQAFFLDTDVVLRKGLIGVVERNVLLERFQDMLREL